MNGIKIMKDKIIDSADITKQILVTQPLLPPVEEFIESVKEIWKNKWLTNNGEFHQRFEKELCDYLSVKQISLFTNGTLALMTALQALRVTGEVITTPYSFVATTHALHWNGIKPVFCDIEPDTLNLDPEKIEAAITLRTTAILPVHIYGNPCQVDEIQRIADIYGLKVLYDAAHAFGVKLNGNSVLNFGDLSILSFHATKTLNTFEGGAIICHDAAMKKRIDYLKNFGFADEITVVGEGINGKMNEVQAAMGLLQLKYIDAAIEKRKSITERYRSGLDKVEGVSFLDNIEGVNHNYAYFPVFINEREYGSGRDEMYKKLQNNNIYGRRYFYPLISHFAAYKGLISAAAGNLPVAERICREVICLPLYPDLEQNDINRIINIIKEDK